MEESDEELNRLRSHVGALEELLQVHEGAVLEQASNLEHLLDAYRGLIESVPDALVVVDARAAIARVNTQAETMFGYSREELGGKPVDVLVPERLRSGFAELRAHQLSLQPGGRSEAGLFMRKRDGGEFPVEVSLNAASSEQGPILICVFRDVSERERAAAALRSSEERTRRIIDTAHEAFVGMDASGRITDWNLQAERTFGWPREAALGRVLSETIIPLRYREDHQRGLERFLATGEGLLLNRRFEINALHREGHEFPVELTIAPVPWGSSYLFSAFVHDISARKRAEEDQQRLARELGRSNKALEEFAYAASHDLQEPLRKILTFGERLKAKTSAALGAEGLDFLSRMLNAAARMQALIEGLLSYSRVTRKSEPFRKVELGEVAREVLGDLEVRIEEVGARVEVGTLPSVEADPMQMRQLLQNLVSNALKFRRPGVAPLVKIGGELLNGGGTEAGGGPFPVEACRITVDDNGIGFDEKYADRIFGIFQRLHSREEYEGTGIGLAICRKIVERHGGSITARSTPGEGTRFSVTLPLKPTGR